MNIVRMQILSIYKQRIISSTYSQKAGYYLILIACILFFGNHAISLWDQDEAAYAGFAKQMIESGNWLMPEFMWSEVHRKPPLHFWNIALSYKIFGVNEFAVRFPSVLSVLLTLSLLFWGTKKIWGEKQSFYGMVVLSTSLLVMSIAKVSVTDATLLLFTTLCAISMLHVLLYRSIGWVLIFWIGFAMALLTKGPPVILFTGVLAIILFVLHPNRMNLFRLHPWFFLPLAVLPLGYWGYLCTQTAAGKVFIDWMIDWYILKRVGGSVFGQTGPPGTHMAGLLIFFLPYFLYFPKAIYNGIRGLFNKENNESFLLAAWFVSGWFIYELTPSKLPAYVIAAHVPLSLLIAKLLLQETPKKGLLYVHILLNGIIYLAFIAAPFYLELSAAIKTTFFIAGTGLLTSLFIVFRLQKHKKFLLYLVSHNLLFQLMLWCVMLPSAETLKNGSLRVARYIEENANRNSRIIIANNFAHPPSLPFYLKQRFKEVKGNYNINELLQYYRMKDYVLILNQEQTDQLKQYHPNLKYREIKPMFTDRIEQGGYYIVKSEQSTWNSQ